MGGQESSLLGGRRRLVLPNSDRGRQLRFGQVHASHTERARLRKGENFIFSVDPFSAAAGFERFLDRYFLWPEGASRSFHGHHHLLSYGPETAGPLLVRMTGSPYAMRLGEALEHLASDLNASRLRLARVKEVRDDGELVLATLALAGP